MLIHSEPADNGIPMRSSGPAETRIDLQLSGTATLDEKMKGQV